VHHVYGIQQKSPKKNDANLASLGNFANSEAFCKHLVWARDHSNSKEAISLNAKVSQIFSVVGLTMYSPFERSATRPKLNAMRYRYGVGSNFLTGAFGKFEDLMALRLWLKPKFNCPNCFLS
jgi:hypothetical protein